MSPRELKDQLYSQIAQMGQALGSPKRLELLELLSQGNKTVEALSAALQIDIRLTSAHLRTLKAARMVESQRDGRFQVYRLAGTDIAALLVHLRETALEHLLELRATAHQLVGDPVHLSPTDRQTLIERARSGEVVVLDVRPADEYESGHLPEARSIPIQELAERLDELPLDREIVAYCRGPFCLYSDEAVTLLRSHGRRARRISDGVPDWLASGHPVSPPAVFESTLPSSAPWSPLDPSALPPSARDSAHPGSPERDHRGADRPSGSASGRAAHRRSSSG